jgi:transcriptional regulator with XRE-family HTH domain
MRKARDGTPLDREVGSRLATRRLALGRTRAELATRVGISVQQLHKYETGTNRIPASRLFELARALGLRPGDLFPPDEGPSSMTPEAEAEGLAKTVARIPDRRARAALTVLAEALAR